MTGSCASSHSLLAWRRGTWSSHREGPASDRPTVALGAARSKQVEVAEDRCDDVLDHLFQHQTHHRGQAHAMLAGTKVRPPQLDEFLMAGDAPRRAPDLSALGWTEEDLG